MAALRAKKVGNKPKKKKQRAVEEDDDPIPGIDEYNVPPEDFRAYTSVIYGLKGIGKTSIVASISPKTLVFMFEPKRLNLPIRMMALRVSSVPEIENGAEDAWKRFKELVYKAHSNPTVDSIAIDSIDVAYQACLNSVCAENEVLHPGGLNDYGAMWNAVKEEFNSTFNMIKFDTDLGLIFTSHIKEAEIEVNTDGETVENFGPSCSSYAMDYLKKAADFAFFYGRHGNKRAMHVRWNSNIWTACGRNDRFLTPSGQQIAAFQIPNDPTSSGQCLVDAFNNKPVNVLKLFNPDETEVIDEDWVEDEDSGKKKSSKGRRLRKA